MNVKLNATRRFNFGPSLKPVANEFGDGISTKASEKCKKLKLKQRMKKTPVLSVRMIIYMELME